MGVKEKALTAASSIASGDFLRMVTSAGAARKIDYSKLAKAIVEEYNGSTIAGSAQTLKAALDSLNSKFNSIMMNTAGSTEITLERGIYLITTAKAASDSNASDGLYVVSAHNIKGHISVIQNADKVSISISEQLLSITTTTTYISVGILRVA